MENGEQLYIFSLQKYCSRTLLYTELAWTLAYSLFIISVRLMQEQTDD